MRPSDLRELVDAVEAVIYAREQWLENPIPAYDPQDFGAQENDRLKVEYGAHLLMLIKLMEARNA